METLGVLMKESDKCLCNEESTKGCHGIRNGEVYSEYYCDDCYNKRENKSIKDLTFE
jgi:hypothetical protein